MSCSKPKCRSRTRPTYFDTEAEGKFSLGLVYRPGGMKAIDTGASGRPAIVQHFGVVVRDMPPVSAYWEKLGFPALKIDPIPAREDLIYKGKQLLLPHYEASRSTTSSAISGRRRLPYQPTSMEIICNGPPRRREGIERIAPAVPDLKKAVAK